MTSARRPGYVALKECGELDERIARACELLRECTVCPRACRVNRLEGGRGNCRTGLRTVVSSYGPHFGEEPPLVGLHGSGTIFITHCNLACEFCQNFAISQCGSGREVSAGAIAEMMIRLQRQGCHNINIVTPSHVVPQLLKSIGIAADKGLAIPLVYNSGGYDAVPTLRLLDGIVDIYMPDAKYAYNDIASALSHAPDYVDRMKVALREMHRQVGDLVTENDIAVRGLLIRHLVLPGNLAGTDQILSWIASALSKDAYVNIMDQYHPAWHAANVNNEIPFSVLRRPVTASEYRAALRAATACGLHRGFSTSR
jgi:putative pyruvate formate lyase activating enzyme